MLRVAMAASETENPLRLAALQLVGAGATSDELEQRFAMAGAALRAGLADQFLDELLTLGLARVGRNVDGVRHVVPTSLGEQARSRGISEETSVALADLESLRSELLSTIAHELRTPLTVVRTSAGLLADAESAPNEEQRETLVGTIVRSAERMQRLVGDILELSRYRSGAVRLQLRRFDACALARSVVSAVAPLASVRGHRFVIRGCGEELRFAVFGDHRRLEQALLNLVSNAQRFSPDGAEITVAFEGRDGVARWSVEDRGPGIPEADRGRLFERFFVGIRDRVAPGEGTGLGLPTALAIAQAHGGTIEVETQVGRGSTFTLAVPVDGPPGGDEG
jgi:signal transduction histidine kinase